ncbi:MAG TPA: S8 family peptidase [Vicinamibacterales bacterium]|nr:S8 family peptidase [Vicinamibacterales bacterium]
MVRRSALLVLLLWLTAPATSFATTGKLDSTLSVRAQAPRGTSRVIVRTTHGGRADEAIRQAGGVAGRFLRGAGGHVALIPDAALTRLAAHPDVLGASLDRRVAGTLDRAAAAIGAAWVSETLGFDGTGVGVALIDSGVANWHDDLGSRTVVHFADFVNGLPVPHDDYGHGTHVAGIIAGSGYDSGGARRGIAPGANLIVLKVLDAAGDGHISDVIAAIDYAIEQRRRFNIRVINLSVAAGVYESYRTDPLTLAARRAVEAGIVVVTAAGNHGRNARGLVQYGGITSPGNAPWVLTVGASDHHRTVNRANDTIAPFSSRGPSLIDHEVKPDIVAPGVAIASLADAGTTLYARHPEARIDGIVDTATPPYLSLTGTSMAAPAVTATVALMFEANPSLTPNLVKAILQFTAERRRRVEVSAQGAGFLNARGAVQLAARLAGTLDEISDPTPWGRQLLWGSRRVSGGVLTADASAWREDVMWGAAATPEGDDIVWGVRAAGDEPWGTDGRSEDLAVELGLALLSAAELPWDEARFVDAVWSSSTGRDTPRVCVAPSPLLEPRGQKGPPPR